ncbi:MAG: alpha/beta fold hydrolase [Actinomycetota bacterium]|nr:alpha/beta fold hydrolase [Actinomycetota bacterium]
MEKEICFYSDGFKITGTLCFPDKSSEDKKYPIVIMSHGYGAGRNEFGDFIFLAKELAEEGFASLRFDCRGCGYSQYPLGRMLCATDWRQDLISAIYFCSSYPGIDEKRIGLFGESMGGANVIAASSLEKISKCVVALSPIADGFEWLKNNWSRNRGMDEFKEFLNIIEEDNRRQAAYGKSNLIKMKDALNYEQRYLDLVDTLKNSFTDREFTYYVELASVNSIMHLKPLDVVDRISPKPLLLMAGKKDKIVPWEEHSRPLFEKAGNIKKLEVFDYGEHGLLAEPTEVEALACITEWYRKYL